MKQRVCVCFPLLFLIVLLLCHCAGQTSAPVHVKDGKEYGKVRGAFRHRWWNYYERGLSYADGAFYDEAGADLREAISRRKKDQRMARTYGMHFMDYFPHRELGVVQYELGNLDEARAELEMSLSQFPSAKARFYLDRVRKGLLEASGGSAMPPKLTLGIESEEVWTKEDPVILTGVAEDEQYVAAINISGAPLFIESSQKRISFKEPLDLSQGRHLVMVKAKNLLGKEAQRQVTIHVDREGPVVTLEEIKTKPGGIAISGFVYDDAGVSALSVSGQPVALPPGTDVPFKAAVLSDGDPIRLVATDRLGNETSADVPYISAAGSEASAFRQRPILLAMGGRENQAMFLAGLFGSGDAGPPVVRLKGWTKTQTVYMGKVYIEGEVSDDTKVVTLSVNGVPVLRREGVSIVFNQLIDLKEGKNTIVVEAADEAGNKAVEEISITREVPKSLQLAERLSLTVLPFEQRGVVEQTSIAFQDGLIDSLVDQNRFRVVEREKLEFILQEQKLSRSKLIDKDTALKLGQLVAAQSVITGSMIETRTGIEVIGRFIDTETSEILETEDVYSEAKDLQGLRKLAEGLAIKFHLDFPLVEGAVVQQKGDYIFTDLGQDKVKLFRRLIVFREEPIKHPVSGKVLGADNVIIGRARVNQVMADMSKAQLLDIEGAAVKPLDKVITQ